MSLQATFGAIPAHRAAIQLAAALTLTLLGAACSQEGARSEAPEEITGPAGSDAREAVDAPGTDDGREPILELAGDAGGGAEEDAGAPDVAGPNEDGGGGNEDTGESDAPGDTGAADEGTADAADAANDVKVLRLWTFNLLNPSNPLASGADVHTRTKIVVDAIKAEQPDMIAFQEVVQSGQVPNRARFIAGETGYHWEWHQTYSIVLYDEGIAVLSRHPILETRTRKLPHKDLVLFDRYVLGARVDTPAGEVDFYCTHMTAGGSDSESADQAVEAWSFMSAESEGVPAFLAGDLNAEPDTAAMRFLRGDEPRDGKTGDLTDLWLATRPEDPGFTISPGNPHDRIDYIYASTAAMESFEPASCRLIFDERVDGAFASDHIGVACELRRLEP